MTSNQAVFFATSEDMRNLLMPDRMLDATAFPIIAPLDERIAPLPLSVCIEFHSGERFVLLPNTLSPVEIFYVPLKANETLGQVDDFNSPVVVVSSCTLGEEGLFNGRIFLGNDPDDSRHAAAKRLFATLRKSIKSWERTTRFDISVGPHAAALARAGKLVLRHHQLTLELE